MNTEFIAGVMYKLINPEGLKRELFYKTLTWEIQKSGGVITPLYIVHGDVMGIRFGDGTIDVNESIEKRVAKYFTPVQPEACTVAQLIPRPNKPLQDAANDMFYEDQPPECLPQRRSPFGPYWPALDWTVPIKPLAA